MREYNIKMDLTEVGYENFNELISVIAVMKLQNPL
jgi:hypothetical protein